MTIPIYHFFRRYWMWPALLLAGIAWGGSFSLAKIATSEGAHPFAVTYWQFVIGAAILLVIMAASGHRIPVRIRSIQLYATCGTLGLIIPTVLFFYAAPEISPGIIAITIGSVPVMTAISASTLRVERLSLRRIAGILFGMLSILLLILPNESLPNRDAVSWVLVTLLAALSLTGQNLVIALRKPESISPYALTCGMLLAAAIIMAPVVILTDTFETLPWPWSQTVWAVILRAVISVVAHGLLILLISHAGPVFASQNTYVMTIAGVIWGIIIFHEQHSTWIWISLLAMLIALMLVKPRQPIRTGSN